jgi:hypothetical protein
MRTRARSTSVIAIANRGERRLVRRPKALGERLARASLTPAARAPRTFPGRIIDGEPCLRLLLGAAPPDGVLIATVGAA